MEMKNKAEKQTRGLRGGGGGRETRVIQSLGVARVQECEYGRGMVTFGVSVCVSGGGGGGGGGRGGGTSSHTTKQRVFTIYYTT